MDAVFTSTGQALHVSFLVMAMEPRQDAPLRKALLQIMSSLDHLTATQTQWMKQLQGEASGAVNFAGLTGDEIRAQCAMVTQAVKGKLPAPERMVIHARFIPTAQELVGREGTTPIYRFYYSQDRVDAIQGLTEYLAKNFPGLKHGALDMMIAKAFINHSEIGIPFRALADAFGGNHTAYIRAYAKLKGELKTLEEMAIRRLTPYFEETRLVENNQEIA